MPILLGFWERGFPKSRDDHITVTATRGKKVTQNFTANKEAQRYKTELLKSHYPYL